MVSDKLTNSNDTSSDLKSFMANMRKDSLIKLVESSQLQFKEKCNYLSQKLGQSEDEVQNKIAILQQNSNLIEKFQNKLEELSDHNTELIEQQRMLRLENEYLHAQLKCSEDKFAQLDILYDQKITDLSEKNMEVERKLSELENSQDLRFIQFDQTQTDLKEKLAKAQELLDELNNSEMEKKREKEELEEQLVDLKNTMDQQKIDYEERIKDIQNKLSAALEENKNVNELRNELLEVTEARTEDRKAFNSETYRLTALNADLKATVEDFKKRFSSNEKTIDDLKNTLKNKEKEYENLCSKFKQIARSTKINTSGSLMSNNFFNNERKSSDDPKSLDDTTDSEASSVSVYKFRKRLSVTHESDSKEERDPFRFPTTFGPRNKMRKLLDQIEIPESPVVSSSAFTK